MDLDSGAAWLTQKIRHHLSSDLGFAIGKIGEVELRGILWFLQNRPQHPYPDQLRIHFRGSGLLEIPGSTIDTDIDTWAIIMLESLSHMDGCAEWNGNAMFEKFVLDRYAPTSARFDMRVFEAFYTPNMEYTKEINKDICVVSPFSESVQTQWEKRERLFPGNGLWSDNVGKLFTVQTGFTPFLSGANHRTRWNAEVEAGGFRKAIQYMVDEVCKTTASVVFIGVGVLSIPLAAELKKREKIAIHTGGGTQINFGIKGKRWDTHPTISKLYTSDWIRPSIQEVPGNAIQFVDGATYW